MAPQPNTGAGTEAELPEYAGNYRLESRLGSGGMGVVHMAHSTSGLKLAVKVVHAGYAENPEFRGRFRQEVAAARRVSGAFTAPVVDADPDAVRPWMATLFIPGPTLAEQVKRNGPLDATQSRRLMAGLAEALRDIHRAGVVHRDLKPGNVLLAEDGPKVIDFGISRPADSELRTETGKLIGTPPFMAPEQFRRPKEVGPAADVFALGSVLVHATTGRGPFDSDSPYVVAYQVVHDEPDLTGVPEDLAPLVRSCLAKEPGDRPTPDELMRELRSTAAAYETRPFFPAQRPLGPGPAREAAAEGASVAGGVSATTPAAASRGWLRGRGTRAAAAVVLVVLVVGGAAGAVRWFGGGQAAEGTEKVAVRGAAAVAPWLRKPAGDGSGMPQCVYDEGKLLCLRAGEAFALDAARGTRLWRRSVAGDGTSGRPSLSGGLLQVVTGRRVEALVPSSGRTRWKREVAGQGTAPGTAPGSADVFLVTGADGSVSGIDGGSGGTRWRRAVPGGGTPTLASFPGDPSVYAVTTSADGTSTHVIAVDPVTGAERLRTRLAGSLRPVGSEGGALYFLSVDRASGQTDAVVRYTPATKALRRAPLAVPRLAPQAGVGGGVVYLLAAGGALEAVDVSRPKQGWVLQTAVSRGSAPVAAGGRVYFSAADGRLIAVDARHGTLLGQTPPRLGAHAGELVGSLPAPLVAGSRVYASAPDGSVFAVDARHPSGW
ncbi:protein kinase domain-containing protein [Streptomyces sp. NPDC005435]|uniref:protein kinase domain-containing protein n=1 Tax=Streptomyces sp. NPDC005435 TaxID=3154464 RepID=UPI0034538F1F